jgi:hypothetical protein
VLKLSLNRNCAKKEELPPGITAVGRTLPVIVLVEKALDAFVHFYFGLLEAVVRFGFTVRNITTPGRNELLLHVHRGSIHLRGAELLFIPGLVLAYFNAGDRGLDNENILVIAIYIGLYLDVIIQMTTDIGVHIIVIDHLLYGIVLRVILRKSRCREKDQDKKTYQPGMFH